MILPEHTKTYERRIGDTVYAIVSESPPEAELDMADAIIELAKRELTRANEPDKLT